MRKVLTYMLAVFTAFAAFGQNPADSTKVYFRIGHRHFDLSLGDNRASMDGFVDKVRKADNIDRLVVRAYASPDGQNNANIRLTHFRCESIADYIIKHSGVSRDLIQSYPEGIAWDELRRMVAANPDVPSREKILDILDNTPVWIFDAKGRVVDGRKKQLMDIDGGKPYRWMFDHIFPQLRNTVAVSLYIADGNNDAAATTAAANADADAATANNAGCTNAATTANAAIRSVATGSSDNTASAAGAIQTGGSTATAATDAVQNAGSTATENAAQTAATTDKSESDGQSAKSDASETADMSDASGVSETSGLGQAGMQSGTTSIAGAAGTAVATSETGATGTTGSAGSADGTCTPNHRFALKTNLLYYAALMPNLEFEWMINSRWSLAAEGNVAWWNNEPKHKTYRLAVISPEVHYWIRPRAPWHGMFVGLFAGGGWYDLENGGMGVRGEGGMAGLSFGYMWPISRNLSLEAAIGAGYMYTRYKEYEPYEGHYLYMRTKSMNYFGPLKVKFQLVWRFNDINKHKKSAPAL